MARSVAFNAVETSPVETTVPLDGFTVSNKSVQEFGWLVEQSQLATGVTQEWVLGSSFSGGQQMPGPIVFPLMVSTAGGLVVQGALREVVTGNATPPNTRTCEVLMIIEGLGTEVGGITGGKLVLHLSWALVVAFASGIICT